MKKYQYDNAQEIVKQMREDRKMVAKYILNYDIYQTQVDKNIKDDEWLQAIDLTLRTYGERKRIFIMVRQEAEGKKTNGRGRHAWTAYVQRRYAEEINKRFINARCLFAERTLKEWWRQIINRIIEMHLRLKGSTLN